MSEKKSTFLDHGKLALTAPKQANGAYPAKLKVQTFNNNPQFTVFSGVTSAKRSGIINAGMDQKTFYTALLLIERMIKEPTPTDGPVIYKIQNDAGRGAEKTAKSFTIIGKDEKGVMFISITDVDDNMPKVRFDFNTDFYHTIMVNGMDKAEISCISAQAWVDMWRSILGSYFVETYEKPAPFNPGGGGFGGNSGGGGGGSAGGSDNPW